MVIVNITLAIICFGGSCYPALVGINTPIGEFNMTQLITDQPGYGGDVLEFKETHTDWYAIHRVWTLKPKQHRLERLASSKASDRINVTGGCINVSPYVYEKLKECCSDEELKINK
jgi:hypothetical protein